jgi:uncharacterized protein (TIGR02246 family)
MASDEQQIRDLVHQWMAATRAGDFDTVLTLMTDDVVFLVAGRPPFGKQEFAAQNRSQSPGEPLPVIDGHSDIEEIQIVGDTAYVRTRLAVTVTSPQGETNRRAGYTLSVLRKSQGRWQIARDANLLTPAKD